mmetsp:Transcript_50162/g.82637  ORF Transcript_50162/g.82637 Transcript_50162/m.82637 type:complete len:260 (+) Transcript_50162:303-1082(+)
MVARPKSHGGRFRQTEGTSLSFYHRLHSCTLGFFGFVWPRHVLLILQDLQVGHTRWCSASRHGDAVSEAIQVVQLQRQVGVICQKLIPMVASPLPAPDFHLKAALCQSSGQVQVLAIPRTQRHNMIFTITHGSCTLVDHTVKCHVKFHLKVEELPKPPNRMLPAGPIVNNHLVPNISETNHNLAELLDHETLIAVAAAGKALAASRNVALVDKDTDVLHLFMYEFASKSGLTLLAAEGREETSQRTASLSHCFRRSLHL